MGMGLPIRLCAALVAFGCTESVVLDGSTGSDAGPTDGGVQDAGGPGEPCDAPGAVEAIACGRCGSSTRFCTIERAWQYGPCEGETGVCAPGDDRDGACGRCGTAREVCNTACAWEAIGACAGEGACAPGETMSSAEGCPEGERNYLCSAACVFEPVSDCLNDPCPTPGALENVSCGRCGTQSRFCGADGEWAYGTCGGEGPCAPGATSAGPCGNCGTQELVCSATCAWAPNGMCAGEGECAPGAMTLTASGCAAGEQRPMTCNDACTYVASGPCVMSSPCTEVETFERGSGWPWTPWVEQASPAGTLSSTLFHDGSWGLVNLGWHYRTDVSFGAAGERLDAWVYSEGGDGRVYLGFAASAGGAKSLVFGPNTSELQLADNVSYGFSTSASVSYTYTTNRWYRLEIQIASGNQVVGRLYNSDGTTVLATVTHTFSSSVVGGIAIRSFNGLAIDTIRICR